MAGMYNMDMGGYGGGMPPMGGYRMPYQQASDNYYGHGYDNDYFAGGGYFYQQDQQGQGQGQGEGQVMIPSGIMPGNDMAAASPSIEDTQPAPMSQMQRRADAAKPVANWPSFMQTNVRLRGEVKTRSRSQQVPLTAPAEYAQEVVREAEEAAPSVSYNEGAEFWRSAPVAEARPDAEVELAVAPGGRGRGGRGGRGGMSRMEQLRAKNSAVWRPAVSMGRDGEGRKPALQAVWRPPGADYLGKIGAGPRPKQRRASPELPTEPRTEPAPKPAQPPEPAAQPQLRQRRTTGSSGFAEEEDLQQQLLMSASAPDLEDVESLSSLDSDGEDVLGGGGGGGGAAIQRSLEDGPAAKSTVSDSPVTDLSSEPRRPRMTKPALWRAPSTPATPVTPMDASPSPSSATPKLPGPPRAAPTPPHAAARQEAGTPAPRGPGRPPKEKRDKQLQQQRRQLGPPTSSKRRASGGTPERVKPKARASARGPPGAPKPKLIAPAEALGVSRRKRTARRSDLPGHERRSLTPAGRPLGRPRSRSASPAGRPAANPRDVARPPPPEEETIVHEYVMESSTVPPAFPGAHLASSNPHAKQHEQEHHHRHKHSASEPKRKTKLLSELPLSPGSKPGHAKSGPAKPLGHGTPSIGAGSPRDGTPSQKTGGISVLSGTKIRIKKLGPGAGSPSSRPEGAAREPPRPAPPKRKQPSSRGSSSPSISSGGDTDSDEDVLALAEQGRIRAAKAARLEKQHCPGGPKERKRPKINGGAPPLMAPRPYSSLLGPAGRPPAVPASGQPSKRKPGRPPGSGKDMTRLKPPPGDGVKRKMGWPPGSSKGSSSSALAPGAPADGAVKRKPGRQPGSGKGPMRLSEDDESTAPLKRKPGRPPGSGKNSRASSLGVSETGDERPLKRPPGRPPGSGKGARPPSSTPSIGDGECAPGEPPVKRKPGRPPGSGKKAAVASMGGGAGGARFNPGEVVWAKMVSFPWWPGQVQLPSSPDFYDITHKEEDYFVVFYGDSNYKWLPPSHVRPFHSDYEARSAAKNRGLQEAIDSAWEAIGRPRPNLRNGERIDPNLFLT